LWDTFRSTALGLGAALAQSFQRLTAHKRLQAALPAAVDAGFQNGTSMVTLPKEPGVQAPEKTKVTSAA